MQAAQDRARREHEVARETYETKIAQLRKSKTMLNKELLNVDTRLPWDVGLGRVYCKLLALVGPKKAEAQAPAPVQAPALPLILLAPSVEAARTTARA